MKTFMQKYRFAVGALVLVFVAGLLFSARNGLFGHLTAPDFLRTAVAVTTAPASLLNKDTQVVLTGSVEGRKAAPIVAEISGRVTEVSVVEGQVIKAGQPLIHIEGPVGSGAAHAPAASALARDEGAIQQAQANYDTAAKEYSRYQKLYEQGAIARRQLESSTARLQAAQEALSIAQTAKRPSSGGAAQLKDSSNLAAPVDGTVTGLSVSAGKAVRAGQQLMVLETGGEVRIVVHLEQKDLYLVRKGTPAEITVDGIPGQVFSGKVEGIFPGAEKDNQFFRTHIQVENPGGILKPGMSVSVRLNSGKQVLVRAVPASAIVQDQGSTILFLAVDGTAVRQQVHVGPPIGEYIEIISGLPEQALVVTSNVSSLKDGAPLTIQ